MTYQDIALQRLANQRIVRTADYAVADIVEHMGAMQAQDYHGSLWALGTRTGLTRAQIVARLDKLEVIRTWPQRGTIHLVPPQDAEWLVGLSAERLLKGAARRRQSLSIDDMVIKKSRQAARRVLQNGARLTRPEFMNTLEAEGINTKSGVGYHILWYLSQTGVTYIGPMKNKQQTIGLLADVPAARTVDAAEGKAQLARRYFTSHGPATLQDFMWWSGLTGTDAKQALVANDGLFTSAKLDGKEYWMPLKSPALPSEPAAFLLASFDEYLLGYKDRDAVLPPEYSNQVVPGSNGMFKPIIVINGQVVGTWQRTVRKDSVVIALEPFTKLTSSDRGLLKTPLEAYSRFLDLPYKLAG